MRIIISPNDGKTPMCYHCARPYERHPDLVRREEQHARLCAIEDDERAARAFHYYRTLEAKHDEMETVWVNPSGFYIPDVGSVRFEGVTLRLEPGASNERVTEALERWVLPCVKKEMLDALERRSATATTTTSAAQLPPYEKIFDPRSSTVTRHDPTWCPAEPSAAELYPSGYVRRADGAVEAVIC
jgi:hypothetical protein